VILKDFSITHQQYNVLRILKGKYPENCAVNDIKEVMIDKSPDLTRLLDRLINKQLIKRSVCEVNRRKLDIAITGQGLDLLKKIAPKLKEEFGDKPKITQREADELNRILDKMRE
jgi:DNA-binding MarR family transcriptional regulator